MVSQSLFFSGYFVREIVSFVLVPLMSVEIMMPMGLMMMMTSFHSVLYSVHVLAGLGWDFHSHDSHFARRNFRIWPRGTGSLPEPNPLVPSICYSFGGCIYVIVIPSSTPHRHSPSQTSLQIRLHPISRLQGLPILKERCA